MEVPGLITQIPALIQVDPGFTEGQDFLYGTGNRVTGEYSAPVVLEGKRLLTFCEGASLSLACEAMNMRADEIHLNAIEVEKTNDIATSHSP